MGFNSKLRWVYLVGFFLILALPLLNLPPWFSPPDWGKTIVFRIVLSSLIFLFIYQLLLSKDSTFSTAVGNVIQKRNRAFGPFLVLIALFVIFLLATIFSLDRNFSLWGSPYRSGGFVNFAFYIIFAILVFLILRKSDWQKIWDFAILIGIFVSIIAIFQQFGLISKIFIPFESRAPSTIGGPIFLAIYLLLLSFLALSFGIKEVKLWKKIFYFLSLLLFIFVAVFITQTRAVIIGYFIGFLYFILFYPTKKFWIFLVLKLLALIVLLSGIYGIYFVNTQTELPQFIQKNKFLNGVTARLSIEVGLADSRISGWKVALQALKDRPILGYGLENFSIGFDKYYDPSLPGIEKMPGVVHSWWDRAHNFVFDIGVTAGIPALIIYLALFGVLFWQLQGLKRDANIQMHTNDTNKVIIAHGIQATFLAYLVANFFSFDTFSTYLTLFLLIAYSLHLLAKQEVGKSQDNRSGFTRILTPKENKFPTGQARIYADILKWKKIILLFLFVLLIWFVWDFNIKPLQINGQINTAIYESQHNFCENALNRVEKILSSRSILDSYLRLKYIDVIQECLRQKPELTFQLSLKATQLLKEVTEMRPYYTRSWLLLGGYTNALIEVGQGEMPAEDFEKLKNEVNFYFEKAFELSPKRQEVLIEWTKADLVAGEYQKAEERAQKCVDLNSKLGDCYWLQGLSQIFLGEKDAAKSSLQLASQKGYPIGAKISLVQLLQAYNIVKDYPELILIFQQLVSIEPNNPQYHASLAVAYKEIGDFEKAKKEALKVLELQPEAKVEVEEFLKTLK